MRIDVLCHDYANVFYYYYLSEYGLPTILGFHMSLSPFFFKIYIIKCIIFYIYDINKAFDLKYLYIFKGICVFFFHPFFYMTLNSSLKIKYKGKQK